MDSTNSGASGAPRPGAAVRVAEELRARVVAGDLLPGAKLPEDRMRTELAVSRSTLREAFQLLVRERLVVHVLSTGFFVRQLRRADVADLMTTREIIECGALGSVQQVPESGLEQVESAVTQGHRAAERSDWQGVAAASIEFHRAIVALAGSPRLDTIITQTLTEFRLAYAHMADPLDFHLAYLDKHDTIVSLLRADAPAAATEYLRGYLTASRDTLLQHVPQ